MTLANYSGEPEVCRHRTQAVSVPVGREGMVLKCQKAHFLKLG